MTNEKREELVREVFESIRVKGNQLVSVEPKPEYSPLFAYAVVSGVRNGRGDWIRTNGPLHPMQVRFRTAPHPDRAITLAHETLPLKSQQPGHHLLPDGILE